MPAYAIVAMVMRTLVLSLAVTSSLAVLAGSKVLAAPSYAAPEAAAVEGPMRIEAPAPPDEDQVGGSIVFDEHLLTSPRRDRDYNGGGEISFSGDSALKFGRWLDEPLELLDQLVDVDHSSRWPAAHALAAGLLIFTPADLRARQVVLGDRPYASLFFVSSGRRYTTAGKDVAYDSSLTLGVLGLAAAQSVQHALHALTGSTQPAGWSHQISDGGEPTLRYSLARQALLAEWHQGNMGFDGKWTLAASVGTVTESSIGANLRWGRILSPWWAFTPEQSTYIKETQPGPPALAAHSPSELFLLAGARLKLRAYNALLQGQFRHSDLRYSSDDVNRVLGEAWAGFEFRTSSGLELRYLARWESPELRHSVGSRSIVWGSLEFAQAL